MSSHLIGVVAPVFTDEHRAVGPASEKLEAYEIRCGWDGVAFAPLADGGLTAPQLGAEFVVTQAEVGARLVDHTGIDANFPELLTRVVSTHVI